MPIYTTFTRTHFDLKASRMGACSFRPFERSFLTRLTHKWKSWRIRDVRFSFLLPSSSKNTNQTVRIRIFQSRSNQTQQYPATTLPKTSSDAATIWRLAKRSSTPTSSSRPSWSNSRLSSFRPSRTCARRGVRSSSDRRFSRQRKRSSPSLSPSPTRHS